MRRRALLVLVAALSGLAVSPPAGALYAGAYGMANSRYMYGSITRLGVTVTWEGYVDSGAAAWSNDVAPGAQPFVESMFGSVRMTKGTASKSASGAFTVTIDPLLRNATIAGTGGGVTINVTITSTGSPQPDAYHMGPGDLSPPFFANPYGFAGVWRAGSAAGSASSSVGSIVSGTGSGAIGQELGASLVYVA